LIFKSQHNKDYRNNRIAPLIGHQQIARDEGHVALGKDIVDLLLGEALLVNVAQELPLGIAPIIFLHRSFWTVLDNTKVYRNASIKERLKAL